MFDPRASQLEQAALGNPKVNQMANHNILLFGFRSSQFHFVMGTRHETFRLKVLAQQFWLMVHKLCFHPDFEMLLVHLLRNRTMLHLKDGWL